MSSLHPWVMLLILIGKITTEKMTPSPQTLWELNGIPIVGYSTTKHILPYGITITCDDILYISDYHHSRIGYVPVNLSSNITFIEVSSIFPPCRYPSDVFVKDKSLYILCSGSFHVRLMSLNGSDSIVVLQFASTLGLSRYFYIDNNDKIHLEIHYSYSAQYIEAMKKAPSFDKTIDWSINRFNWPLNPQGIFVNKIGSIYIADYLGHRILRVLSGAESTTAVAGDGIPGLDLTHLYHPTQVIVDDEEYIYISEQLNRRITRWTPYAVFGVCIAGCAGPYAVSAMNSISPLSFAFDSNGSLYVSDGHTRVLKFQARISPQISYNQPKICLNAKWDFNATMKSNAFFIDNNDTIYVADRERNQILILKEFNDKIVQQLDVDLYIETSLFVTLHGDIYFENANKTGQIDKWPHGSKKTELVIMVDEHCNCLFIDIDDTLYCSISEKHKIIKASLTQTNPMKPIIINSFSIAQPGGIFVDRYRNMYVSNLGNNRIQMFQPGHQNGFTIVGYSGVANTNLKGPSDVILDAYENLYIADTGNKRIVRFGRNGLETIIDQNDTEPHIIRFDSQGNLYVLDKSKSRIQKFILRQDSCDRSTATTTTEATVLATYSSTKISFFTYLISWSCPNSTNIGINCSYPGEACDLFQFCFNNGTCIPTLTGQKYNCSCAPGFTGNQCQEDRRPCQRFPCQNNGTCNETSSYPHSCICSYGWEGNYCEKKINYCHNISCHDHGVCHPLVGTYKCECFSGMYYGDHCEFTKRKIVITKFVARSMAYVAILAMASVAIFIIVMDILKYGFGIDPVHEEREKLRHEKRMKQRRIWTYRYIYVNQPTKFGKPIKIMKKQNISSHMKRTTVAL